MKYTDDSSSTLDIRIVLPAWQVNFLAGGMLRCSGNRHVPSMLNVLMCLLDIVFNFFLIFPSRQVECLGVEFTAPGAGFRRGRRDIWERYWPNSSPPEE
jgi:Na+-driven multidrug efflux pump